MRDFLKTLSRIIFRKMRISVLQIEVLITNTQKPNSAYVKVLYRISYGLTLFDLLIYKKRISFFEFILLQLININPRFPNSILRFQKLNCVHSILASTTNLEHLHLIMLNDGQLDSFVRSVLIQNPQNISKFDWIKLARILEHYDLWREYYYLFLEALKNLTAKEPKLGWNISYAIFQELAIFGNLQIGEQLLIEIKNQATDLGFQKNWRDDGIYFSAIGHLAQFGWLVEAHQLYNNLVGANFKIGKYDQGNSLLAQKWIDKTKNLGWEFSESDDQDNPLACDDLETFPTSTGARLLRREIGTVHSDLLRLSKEPLLELSDQESSKALLLLQEYGLPKTGEFNLIGIHVRSGLDIFTSGRNSYFSKYKVAAEIVADHGDWTIAIGDEEQGSKFAKMELPNFINLAIKKNTNRELLHLYVWANSRFFIGNLSGATFPPMIFRIPTLWVDLYPLRHFRPPSVHDLIIPKIILQESPRPMPVSYRKVLDVNNYLYDSENPFIRRARGLRLKEADSTDIVSGVEEMYRNIYQKSRPIMTSKQITIESLYEGLNLPIGAAWSPGFLNRWGNLLF